MPAYTRHYTIYRIVNVSYFYINPSYHIYNFCFIPICYEAFLYTNSLIFYLRIWKHVEKVHRRIWLQIDFDQADLWQMVKWSGASWVHGELICNLLGWLVFLNFRPINCQGYKTVYSQNTTMKRKILTSFPSDNQDNTKAMYVAI